MRSNLNAGNRAPLSGLPARAARADAVDLINRMQQIGEALTQAGLATRNADGGANACRPTLSLLFSPSFFWHLRPP
jgi:hypothetical protein